MKLLRIVLPLICLLALLVPSCSSSAPIAESEAVLARYDQALEKYNQVTSEMSYDQVAQLMGGPGKQVTTGEGSKLPFYSWTFAEFSISAGFFNLNNNFDKGFNWDMDPAIPMMNAVSTKEKLNTIELGMTYDQVVSIMGNPGMVLASKESIHLGRKTTGAMYVWWTDDKLPSIFISFIDEKVTNK